MIKVLAAIGLVVIFVAWMTVFIHFTHQQPWFEALKIGAVVAVTVSMVVGGIIVCLGVMIGIIP
jgi:hypothetical protein